MNKLIASIFAAALAVSGAARAQQPQVAGSRAEPDWLTPYPRSTLGRQFVNPLDATLIPLTQPAYSATTTRYAVPMLGKVTILQYRNAPDDSPLLIIRHYDAVLAQRGFERVIACSIPCPRTGGASSWMKMVDPGRPDDYNYFPDAPLVLIAYKTDAMVFVAVGKNANYPNATFVKLVEGEIQSRSDLDLWLASLRPSAPPPPSTPALVAPQVNTGARMESIVTSDVVEAVAPARIASAVAQTRGKIFVMLTSTDPNCIYCIRANPAFVDFAARQADKGRFVTTSWQPWRSAFANEFVTSHGVNGLPAFLVFRDGIVVARASGTLSVDQLQQVLLKEGAPAEPAVSGSAVNSR